MIRVCSMPIGVVSGQVSQAGHTGFSTGADLYRLGSDFHGWPLNLSWMGVRGTFTILHSHCVPPSCNQFGIYCILSYMGCQQTFSISGQNPIKRVLASTTQRAQACAWPAKTERDFSAFWVKQYMPHYSPPINILVEMFGVCSAYLHLCVELEPFTAFLCQENYLFSTPTSQNDNQEGRCAFHQ